MGLRGTYRPTAVRAEHFESLQSMILALLSLGGQPPRVSALYLVSLVSKRYYCGSLCHVVGEHPKGMSDSCHVQRQDATLIWQTMMSQQSNQSISVSASCEYCDKPLADWCLGLIFYSILPCMNPVPTQISHDAKRLSTIAADC